MIYRGKNLREILFPLGGIGTGSISIAGNGALSDYEIFNRPAKGSGNGFTHIGVRAKVNGKTDARVLQSDFMGSRMGQYSGARFSGYGYGPFGYTMAAFPHFKNVTFDGSFPIAKLTFSDPGFPAKLTLTAFNPFIPLDAFNSSLPAAFFRLEITALEDMTFGAEFTVRNPNNSGVNAETEGGVFLKNAKDAPDTPEYNDMTLLMRGGDVNVQPYWYRGKWQDCIATFVKEWFGGNTLIKREYPDAAVYDQATVWSEFDMKKGEKRRLDFVLSWSSPVNQNYWNPLPENNTWKNYYATQFATSLESAGYCLKNFDSLLARTKKYKNALFSSTLDESILDAVSATSSVLKSPTVLRLEDGSFYGWEGVHEQSGSCEGTCEHVWNYAYCMPFLFPELERSIRNLEYRYALMDSGMMEFRLKLPLGREFTPFRACVDGQMGSVIKTYREWKISGDTEWMKSVYPSAKKALDYAVSAENPDEWDRDADGVLEGRQHHTLDMELFGPSSWLESFYLGALRCGSLMAQETGDTESAERWNALYEKGRAYTNAHLFNGRYFIHNVDIDDLSVTEHFDAPDYRNDEAGELKYQIGEGCAIDQMCGEWHMGILGLDGMFDADKKQTALDSMMKYNYHESVRDFINPWRVFTLNDEGGSIICAYPEGVRKPVIPVPYCEEAMHGFEYQFAGLLAENGRLDDCVKVVKAVRGRYTGEYRNPFNEMECGSNYARSMASFALLPIISGLKFDLSKGMFGFDPKPQGNFKCLWSLGTGWGTLQKTADGAEIRIIEGYLELRKLELPFMKAHELTIDGKDVPFTGELEFDTVKAKKRIVIK